MLAQQCQLCDWIGEAFDPLSEEQELFAQGMVLHHVAERHPLEFRAATGKDPEMALKEYQKELQELRGGELNV